MKNASSDLMSRRRLLVRLGMVAGAAYAAPALVGFDSARASGNSGGASGGNSGGSSRGGTSGGRSSGGHSRGDTSGPSRRRGTSGASRVRGRDRDTSSKWLRDIFGG